MWRWLADIAVLALLAGCTSAPAPDAAPTPTPSTDGVVRILFLGNSHTARNDVPGTVAALLRAARPGTRVEAVREPSIRHLQERATDPATLDLLASRPWDYVVLQAQNYSLSGRYRYPDDGARRLVHLAHEQGAQVVLFAEWARRGIDETQLILRTYEALATPEPACLPPVPEAFERAAPLHLELLAADGNHSSPAGAFLASAVIAGALLGSPVTRPVPGPAPAVQAQLRAVAADVLDEVPADRRCPPISR